MSITPPTKSRKKRADAKLSPESLGVEKFAALVEGLCCAWTYTQAADYLLAECSQTVSGSAWTEFHAQYVAPVIQERSEFALMGARSVEKVAQESGAFDGATVLELKRKAYQMMRDPSADQEEARKWMETYIKAMAGVRERDKAIAAAKKGIEAGLEALFAEIKGNAKAEALFKQLQEVVSKA